MSSVVSSNDSTRFERFDNISESIGADLFGVEVVAVCVTTISLDTSGTESAKSGVDVWIAFSCCISISLDVSVGSSSSSICCPLWYAH